MSEVNQIVSKLEKGEQLSDDEIKKIATNLLQKVESDGEFKLEELANTYNLQQGTVLRLYAVICARDDFRDSKGCQIFNDFMAKPATMKQKKKKKETPQRTDSDNDTTAPEPLLQKTISADYMDKEFATGGANFDEIGRAFVLNKGVVFHPAIYFIYDMLKRSYVKIRSEDGSVVTTSLLNLSINEEPDRQIGFMSWVNNVILRYYESLGIKPIILMTDYKTILSASFEAQGLKLSQMPDYIKPGNVYVKVRGNRIGHMKVAVENRVEGEVNE